MTKLFRQIVEPRSFLTRYRGRLVCTSAAVLCLLAVGLISSTRGQTEDPPANLMQPYYGPGAIFVDDDGNVSAAVVNLGPAPVLGKPEAAGTFTKLVGGTAYTGVAVFPCGGQLYIYQVVDADGNVLNGYGRLSIEQGVVRYVEKAGGLPQETGTVISIP